MLAGGAADIGTDAADTGTLAAEGGRVEGTADPLIDDAGPLLAGVKVSEGRSTRDTGTVAGRKLWGLATDGSLCDDENGSPTRGED
mmetsp:Transcript_59917/g.142757  ORF Transcript_59917/g.142757 Transcript_59917/m.142757 type:complete len:86 (+) Transcript_59917:224-481(+)|eukprot:CAMPEP_0178437716 /NCGR_PEP_ID=MMETSP0689_2-20121128/35161_1 /TAXON_ID=160604 /ORGANISM="Amphidinium massartii, Strain CS-259" /LENGTH=85 /DNA_ID=CAMNT_0020059977 /DNA_START=208 /DNA_END=465 /DNA_ORIENTATION=+